MGFARVQYVCTSFPHPGISQVRTLRRWAPKGCRLEGMILDTKGTRAFRCNAAKACDHFRELERACRGGGEC